jgi:hypothetical protein
VVLPEMLQWAVSSCATWAHTVALSQFVYLEEPVPGRGLVFESHPSVDLRPCRSQLNWHSCAVEYPVASVHAVPL